MATPRTGNPRGRPKGAKNKPKTIEAFVHEALTSPPVSPPRTKLKARGPWAGKTPEERRALSAKLNAGRDLSKIGGGRKVGVPASRTNKQHALVVAAQQPEIERIMKKMADQGILPDDPRAAKALKVAVKLLKTSVSAKDQLAAARLVLDFTKSKPTTKIEATIKTAEDFLDEMDND